MANDTIDAASSKRIRYITICFFILIALTLGLVNRKVIAKAGIEVGDFAANSLLIQDAKSFSLLTGNYSRVGFNHPGPAILYVLAAGEVLFYDWTRLAPSPMSGQLIAVVIYSAFWITLIGAIFYRSSKSFVDTALFLSVFLAVSAFSEYHVFAGAWFPHLYYFPFATFTLAIASLACGRSDSLSALALSCGFLINGHVSFVSTTAIMLGAALLANQVLSRGNGERACPNWISLKFLSKNKAALYRALAWFSIFIIPILIETVFHFPGPIAKYASFGAGNPRNTLLNASSFVISYWGENTLSLLFALLCLCLIYVCARGEEYFTKAKGVLVSIIGATVALVFYAMVGIDNLTFKYLGLFYYSVPAIAVATAAYCLYRRIQWDRRQLLAIIAIVLSTVLVGSKIGKAPGYESLYSEPGVAQLYEKVRSLGPLPVVLDLDPGNDWGYVWGRVVGLEAYAKRRGVDLLCVDRNWHILFTEAAKCTPQQIRDDKRFAVSTSSPLLETDSVSSFNSLGLLFYSYDRPLLPVPSNFTIARDTFLFRYSLLGKGWSSFDGEFVWSDGKEAELLLRVPAKKAKLIHLDLVAYLPRGDSVQHVEVQSKGATLANFDFGPTANKGIRSFAIPERTDELIDLKLLISNPVSPLEEKLSVDSRKLGVGLFGISIE